MKKVAATIVLACSSTLAQAQVWENTEIPGGYHIAKVGNDANYVAGVICERKSGCSAYIVPATPCEVNASYAMMINSPIGAFPITSKCVAIGDAKVQGIDQLDSALAAFRSGGEIGFAIPLKSGKFNVVRFSTAGASAAIDRAISEASAAPASSSASKVPTSVQTL